MSKEDMNAEWLDKIAAQQRHEHLAATVRIAIGELCQVGELTEELGTAERVYAITEILEEALKVGEVAYMSSGSVRP